MKKIFFIISYFIALSVNAAWEDCAEAGYVDIWLGPLATAVLEQNPNSSKRLKDIVDAYNKKDSGKSLSAIKNLYNCTFIAMDPNPNSPNGVWILKFTEKRFGSSPQERVQNTPRSFVAGLIGGAKKAINSKNNHCYAVSYWDEQGKDVKNDAYLLIEDVTIPLPKKVSSCS